MSPGLTDAAVSMNGSFGGCGEHTQEFWMLLQPLAGQFLKREDATAATMPFSPTVSYGCHWVGESTGDAYTRYVARYPARQTNQGVLQL